MLLHVLLAVVIPNVKFDNVKIPEVLEVELVNKPEPPPVLQPEPIQPQPEQPKPEQIKPKTEPKPIIKPLPTPAVVKDDPAPHQPPPTTQTEVIAVAPVPEVPPSPVPTTPVVMPEPPKQTEPSEDDINAARSAYIQSIHKELKRNHRYPRIAELRGIQGEVKVEIKFDKEGNVVSAIILESSGNAILDDGALATIRRSNFKQYMKNILYGRIGTVTVPISFKITER